MPLLCCFQISQLISIFKCIRKKFRKALPGFFVCSFLVTVPTKNGKSMLGPTVGDQFVGNAG